MHLFGMCNHTVNATGNLDNLLPSHFPGLVLPHATYSFMRNSHVFPKASHLETDARLPPGLGAAVGVCIEHPRGSRCRSGAAAWGSEHRRVAPSSPCLQHRLSRQALVPSGRLGQVFIPGEVCPVALNAPGLKKVLVVIPDAEFQSKE